MQLAFLLSQGLRALLSGCSNLWDDWTIPHIALSCLLLQPCRRSTAYPLGAWPSALTLAQLPTADTLTQRNLRSVWADVWSKRQAGLLPQSTAAKERRSKNGRTGRTTQAQLLRRKPKAFSIAHGCRRLRPRFNTIPSTTTSTCWFTGNNTRWGCTGRHACSTAEPHLQ